MTYAHTKAWRERHPEQHREQRRRDYQRAYRANPDKFIERTRAWQLANPEKVREYNRKACATRFEKDREKVYARAAVQRALRSGKLVRGTCAWSKTARATCGEATVHAHHFAGYDKPNWLNIIWLCPAHHKAMHRVLKGMPS